MSERGARIGWLSGRMPCDIIGTRGAQKWCLRLLVAVSVVPAILAFRSSSMSPVIVQRAGKVARMAPYTRAHVKILSAVVPRDERSVAVFGSKVPWNCELEAGNNETEAVTRDADKRRRRQILFSLLAAASSTQLKIPHASAVTVNGQADPIELRDIFKPPLDDREYLTFQLKNGLRVLLCSDLSSNEAAAAMDVHVGACSDPVEVPGLAHFNEHMLFLGTKSYPKEDSFEAFLATNGGKSNAYTDSENTVYYFEMEVEADPRFAEGLKRFGSFFTSPLFTESATGRELNAIESENAKNLQSDTFRVFQISKSRANKNHPFSKFFTGNKKTLLDDTKAQGINLRDELIKFYNSYYSANLMTLAIVAPVSIDELKRMVIDAFADVPNREIVPPESAWAGVPPYGPDSLIPSFGHVVEIVPVQDIRQVTISWPVVYTSDDDKQNSLLVKQGNYVAHLLGHEATGSLLSYLKNRGWANSVSAGSGDSLSDFENFEVVVSLTTRGLASVDNVIESVFAYINMLRSRRIPSYVFEEVLQLDELQWRFLTKGNVGSYAQSIATAMQKFAPPLYVAGPRRLALDDFGTGTPVSSLPRNGFSSPEQLDHTRDLVSKYTDFLGVENAVISVLSKTFDGRTDLREKWYGTDYRIRPLAPEVLNRWRGASSSRKLNVDFPAPNPFIPSERGLRVKKERKPMEQLRKRSFESRMAPQPSPTIIRDDGPEGRWTVHFKQDETFGQPKAYVIFQLLSKDVFSSPVRAALSNLYELCVSDKLREYAYDAELAGLTYDVKALPRGVRLTFGGYNDRLEEFASYISRKLFRNVKDVLPKDDSDFARYKDQIMRALSAFDVRQPYAHASYYAQLTLQPRRFQYSNKELRDATRNLLLPDLLEYAKTLWATGKGEALIQGNFDKDEALNIVSKIGDAIPFRPISESEYPPRLEALPLPISNARTLPTRVLVTEPNPADENSVSYVMLQSLGATDKDHVLIELLSSIVDEPFYNELRTKQQLGYIVASGAKGIGESRTLSFIVQSSVATADDLTIAILAFLDTIESAILEKLPKADLAVYVKSLIDRKTEPDKDLIAEVTRNWSEIASGRLQFNRRQQEAAALLEIEKEDLIDFWRRIYAGNGRRVLISNIIPRRGVASSAPPPTSTRYIMDDLTMEGLTLGVDDIEQFRRDREKMASSQIT